MLCSSAVNFNEYLSRSCMGNYYVPNICYLHTYYVLYKDIHRYTGLYTPIHTYTQPYKVPTNENTKCRQISFFKMVFAISLNDNESKKS